MGRALLAAWFAVPLVLLGVTALRPAISPGTVDEYWAVACGASPNALPQRFGYSGEVGLLPEKDGWLYYYAQRHHDQPLFRIAARDLEGTRPAPDARSNCESTDRVSAHWCEISFAQSEICAEAGTSEARALHAQLVKDVSREQRSQFEARLSRAAWKPVALIFEGAFLCSWQAFLAWPWLLGQRRRQKLAHLTLAPLLLFGPFYLGYAPLVFTSGPSGGFVYPIYLALTSLPVFLTQFPCTPLDSALLSSLPRPLIHISQLPGPALATTSFGCIGPLACLATGLVAAGLFWIGTRFSRSGDPSCYR